MEESLKKHPLLPSNYVSLQMLQERRIKEQQQKKKQVEEEEERKLRLEEERKRRLEEDERKRREEEEEEEEKRKREEEEKVRALQNEISLSNRRRQRYRKRGGKECSMKQEGGAVNGDVDEEKSEESKGRGGDLNGKVIRLKKKLGFQRKKKGLMDSKAEIERKDSVFAVVGGGGDDDDSKEVKLKVEEGGVNWKRSAGGTNERRRWSSRDKKKLETNSEVVVEPWPSVEIIRRIGSMTVTDDGKKVAVDIELLMGKSRSRSTMRVNSGGGGGKGEGEFSGSLRRSGYGRGSRRVVNCGGGGGDGGEFGGYRRRFGKDGNLMWVRKEESKDGEAAGSGSVRFGKIV